MLRLVWVLAISGALPVVSCGSQCPERKCNSSTLDLFQYCIDDKNCAIDGTVITSCTNGDWSNCPLRQLKPGEVLSIPLDRIWRDAGSAHDFEFAEFGNKQLDLSKVVIMLDDKPVPCVVTDTVLCRGVDPTARMMKIQHSGPGSTLQPELYLSDKSCKPPPCQV